MYLSSKIVPTSARVFSPKRVFRSVQRPNSSPIFILLLLHLASFSGFSLFVAYDVRRLGLPTLALLTCSISAIFVFAALHSIASAHGHNTPIPHRPRIPRIDTNRQIFGFVAESYSVREGLN